MVLAGFSTKKFGMFRQVRVGEDGKLFKIYKIRTMKVDIPKEDFITLKNDDRITPFGKVLRKYKLDELPQLINIIVGEMSLVGPRPDVPGYADNLVGEDRIILTVKPGLTGSATLKFKNEENLLSKQKNPKKFNDEVIWPEKVKLNRQYIKEWSLFNDIKCIVKTIIN